MDESGQASVECAGGCGGVAELVDGGGDLGAGGALVVGDDAALGFARGGAGEHAGDVGEDVVDEQCVTAAVHAADGAFQGVGLCSHEVLRGRELVVVVMVPVYMPMPQ